MKSAFIAATILFTTPLLAACSVQQNAKTTSLGAQACQQVVDAELRRVGVSPDAIASTRIERDYADYGDGGRVLTGYTYWMRMKSCQKGYLLVQMHNDFCLPIGDPATVYGCEIAGVKKE